MTFKRSVMIGAVASAILAFQPAVAQTLTEAVEQTIRTNPDVLIDVNRRLANEEAVRQARGGYLPRVDLALGWGGEWSENVSTRPGSDRPSSPRPRERRETFALSG